MTYDYRRTLDRLYPPGDGEQPVRHRTATITAVNGDGTVDIDLGGVTVPSVSVLSGTTTTLGQIVQVLVWAGDLLVLGTAGGAGDGPLGKLGYAQITANLSPAAPGPTDLTGLSVTITAGTSRRLRITGYTSTATASVAADRFRVEIYEGSTLLNSMSRRFATTSAEDGFHAAHVLAPSAGAHTYKLALFRIGGTGALTWGADPTRPSFILVEDIGPA